METDTIEFHASEAGGDWYFHCHILYHMMAGMGRIFSYENSSANPDIPNPEKAYARFTMTIEECIGGPKLDWRVTEVMARSC